MLTMSQLKMLSQLECPLLTAYVHTSPVEAFLHGLTHGYLTSLRNDSRRIVDSLPPVKRELFLKQLDRVEESLRQRTRRRAWPFWPARISAD